MAQPADGERDNEDNDDLFGEVIFSPVCTWCAHWKPGDGRHCAGAYPKGVGGPQIPLAIWRGDNLHLKHIASPNDHNVLFDLHPDAKPDALKAANPDLYDGYMAREAGKGKPQK